LTIDLVVAKRQLLDSIYKSKNIINRLPQKTGLTTKMSSIMGSIIGSTEYHSFSILRSASFTTITAEILNICQSSSMYIN